MMKTISKMLSHTTIVTHIVRSLTQGGVFGGGASVGIHVFAEQSGVCIPEFNIFKYSIATMLVGVTLALISTCPKKK